MRDAAIEGGTVASIVAAHPESARALETSRILRTVDDDMIDLVKARTE